MAPAAQHREPARTHVRVGIGSRNYGYRRVCYDLPVPNASFRKVGYVPWRYLRPGDPRWANAYLFRPFAGVDLYHLWNGVCLNRRPWVTSFEAHLPRHPGLPKGRLYAHSLRLLESPHCKRLLALSDFAMQLFLRQNEGFAGPSLAAKCEVLYGGVPIFKSRVEEHQRFLERRGGPLVLCMVGNLFFQKGGLALLEAVRQLRSRGADVELVLVSNLSGGDFVTQTSEEARARARARIQSEPGVRWHEQLPHDRVLDLLAQSHVVVLPSLDETFGWSVVEGMSAGLPAITTDVCALPEIVEHGTSGWHIKLELRADRRWAGLEHGVGSERRRAALAEAHEVMVAGLVQAAETFLGDPASVRTMGHAALSTVRARHDPGRIGRQLRQVYEVALGRHDGPLPDGAEHAHQARDVP